MWERQKCQGADKREIGWERYKRSERVRMMVVGLYKEESNGDGSNEGGDKMG